jgi:hypothetical protein
VYTQLASTAIDATAYFSRVFQAPERTPGVGDDKYDEKLARWTAHQQRLLELYASGQGSDLPGVRGTAWAAYNSVTEWVDHHYPLLQSGKVSEARTASVLFGRYGR